MDIQAFQLTEEDRLSQIQTANYITGSVLAVALLVTGVVLLKVPGAGGGAYFYAGAGVAAAAAIPLGVMIGLAVHFSNKKTHLEKAPADYYLDSLTFQEFVRQFAEFAVAQNDTLKKGYEDIEHALLHGDRTERLLDYLKPEDKKLFDAFVQSKRWEPQYIRQGDKRVEVSPFTEDELEFFAKELDRDILFFKIVFLKSHAGGIAASIVPALFPTIFNRNIVHDLNRYDSRYYDDTKPQPAGVHLLQNLERYGKHLWPHLMQIPTEYYSAYRHPRAIAALLVSLGYPEGSSEEQEKIVAQCKKAWTTLEALNLANQIEETKGYRSSFGINGPLDDEVMASFAAALRKEENQ